MKPLGASESCAKSPVTHCAAVHIIHAVRTRRAASAVGAVISNALHAVGAVHDAMLSLWAAAVRLSNENLNAAEEKRGVYCRCIDPRQYYSSENTARKK